MTEDSEFPDEEAVPETASAPAAVRLTFSEARVLGCLLEKESLTPDQYPLTSNALQAACNQSSNREPVVRFDAATVEEAAAGLRHKKLAVLVHQAGARVAKCRHTVENRFPYLTKAQKAVLCVMLLRGPQTVGELRLRTERMHAFPDLDAVQDVLDELARLTPHPLVEMIPAGSGRRTVTFVHTLGGHPPRASEEPVAGIAPDAPVRDWHAEIEADLASLRTEVASLRSEIAALKTELGA